MNLPLPRLLILPALAVLLTLALTASPAGAVNGSCPCSADVPFEEPDLCYERPGAAIGDFAYIFPSHFIQVVGFGAGGYCRHNATFTWLDLDGTLACEEFIRCLCEDGPAGCDCEDQAFASGSAEDIDGEIGIVGLDDDSFTSLGAGDITEGVERTVAGLTFDSTGALFGSAVGGGSSPDNPSNLILIDPSDGSRLQTIGAIEYNGQDRKIIDLATRPSNDVLYGIDTETVLYTIDKTTAVATLVGDTGLGSNGRGGLAFTPDGNLYLATVDEELYRLNPDTAAPIGAPFDIGERVDGLGARSDGLLFGTEQEDDDDIFQIDPATGEVVVIPGDEEISDIAFRCQPQQT